MADNAIWFMEIAKGHTALFFARFRDCAGCDTFLKMGRGGVQASDSPTYHSVMRRALHEVCYTVANSAAMQGVTPGTIVRYDLSPWRIELLLADVLGVLLLAGGTV